jgi:hypothetical protein
MASGVQPVRALYYPRVHFTSTQWLKAALLYWESILRIVPDGFALQDPPEVHELAAAGLIENVSPAPYREAAKRLFLHHLEGSLRRYDDAAGAGRTPSPAERKNYKLFSTGEIDRGLLKELQTHRLAAVADDWVTMPSDMADLYTLGLANEIGRMLYAAPATDGPTSHVAATLLARQEVTGDGSTEAPVDGYACARSIAPFPALEAASVETEKLLRVRQKYADERRAFRALVQARAVAIAELESVEAIESHLRDLTIELENAADVCRSTRRASQLRDAGKIVGVTAPASIGTVVTLSGAPAIVAALGGVGTLVAGFADWVSSQRQTHHVSRYLVSLDVLAGGPRGGGRAQKTTPL